MKYSSDVQSPRDAVYAATSFGLTFSRLIFAGYVGIQLVENYKASRVFAVLGILMLMVFDYLDGVFFSKSSLADVKAWRVNRRILDSAVDRITIQICGISLALADRSFVSFYGLITIREILISGYVSSLYRKGYLLYPGPLAKIACVSIGLTVIAFLIGSSSLTLIAAFAMIALSAFSAKEYFTTLGNYRFDCLSRKQLRLEDVGLRCELELTDGNYS